MNNPDDVRFNNPYTLPETLTKLRGYLKATQQLDGLALLQKAEAKAGEDVHYAREFEKTFLFGSTVQYRVLFSHFGDYMEKSRKTFPFYPHVDAVNAVDSAMHKLKLGLDLDEIAAEYNWLHNHNSARAEIA
ncbi:hypothetical protein [Marinobacter salicampi]|uniref:hypothetical protein n=1 Tax=Marinobacter salicampi TaxID=435907 RepID=UPI001A94A230|nr:hypothetical protein [Marinobacter salicampi]